MEAFLFGTFNPVTNAHVKMGLKAKEVLGDACRIVYVPAGDDYIRSWKGYKDGSILSGDIRKPLLQEAVSEYGFMASTVEVMELTDGKTWNTLEYLGSDDSVLCIGMDNVPEIRKWYRYQDLLAKYRLLIFKRGRYCGRLPDILNESVGYEIAYLGPEFEQTSSTLVRNCYVTGRIDEIRNKIPENVFRYLEENKNVYF